MNKVTGLEKVTDLTLYTGTFGKKGCTCNCIGCTQNGYITKRKQNQGNLEQIKIIMDKLPNLKNAYILGNPDVSVDTKFCNQAAKEFIKNGINVMFSTSGYKALETAKTLFKDLDPAYISYISYSVDTLDKEKMRYLKGSNKLNMKDIEDAIAYCQELNIPVKIQPTLWEINQDDYKEIIDNFYNKFNIRWYTFHAGSFEALRNKNVGLNHVKPSKWKEIVTNIQKIAEEKKLKILLPRIFLNKEEMIECKNNIHTYCANGGSGLQIWLEKDNIRCTYCPLLAEVHPEFTFLIQEKTANFISQNGVCAIQKEALDNDLIYNSNKKEGRIFSSSKGELYNVCRFYSIREDFKS